MTGRQLARVSAIAYRETLWSDLFAGSRSSVTCLQPAVVAIETALDLAPVTGAAATALDLARQQRRSRIVWRVDGGFGSDDNLDWLLARHYQTIAKGFSGRRADKLARQVKRWTPCGDAWLGHVVCPVDFSREVQVWVKRKLIKGEFAHSYYLTTLKLPSLTRAMERYNQRGGAEIEQFRNDKQGLHLSARRKQSFLAQKSLILLTDLAHNLLADLYHTALVDTPFATFGPKRLVRDLLTMEGNLILEAGCLRRIELAESHPYAAKFLDCLVRYCQAEANLPSAGPRPKSNEFSGSG